MEASEGSETSETSSLFIYIFISDESDQREFLIITDKKIRV